MNYTQVKRCNTVKYLEKVTIGRIQFSGAMNTNGIKKICKSVHILQNICRFNCTQLCFLLENHNFATKENKLFQSI